MDSNPWLIVGLGNPGPRYASNRHNIGFLAVDCIAATWAAAQGAGPASWTEKWRGHTTPLRCGSTRCVLLKPQTYMNRSGGSVAPAAQFLRVPPSQLVVLHDEIDFPLGRMAIKRGGGHGGHNGLRDIIQQLGTAEFLRIRLGVGRPVHGEVADYVLSDFLPDQEASAGDLLARATQAVTAIVSDGLTAAMNKFNTT